MAPISRISQFLSIGVSAACGGLATYYSLNKSSSPDDKEQEYYSIFQNAPSKWDTNWDRYVLCVMPFVFSFTCSLCVCCRFAKHFN